MSETNERESDLRRVIGEIADMGDMGELMEDPGEHLEPDAVAVYHDGELPPEEAERVQRHLLRCRECTAMLLDLEALVAPDLAVEAGLTPADRETIWSGVSEAIRRDRDRFPPPQSPHPPQEPEPRPSLSEPSEPAARPDAPVLPFRPSPPAPAPAPAPAPKKPLAAMPAAPRWLQLAATLLLVSTLALSLWVIQLRGTVRDLSQPQLDAPVLDLYPASAGGLAGATRSDSGPQGPAEIPAGARLFTLVLNASHPPADGSYTVVVTRDGDGEIGRWGGLHPNAFGSFTVTLTRSHLGAGDFRIALLAPGSPAPVEEYALHLEAP
jgi:hypothetical protein